MKKDDWKSANSIEGKAEKVVHLNDDIPGGARFDPDTNVNAAVERGDARFLILTTAQADYIEQLIRNQLQVAHDQAWDEMIALGESVLEQLEKK